MTIQSVRGMKDILPPEIYKWQKVESLAREVFACFGFVELRIPVLEKTELFKRSIGEATDIVEKEMYTFEDRSGDSLTMRPEATAGMVRAYLQHKLYSTPGPHKFFTMGPMFRHERPQKGRLRQFHQINVEALGDEGPLLDAEILVMLDQLLTKLGLPQVRLVLNSLGCPECRPAFRQALTGYFADKTGELCPDCIRRLDSNPLRVLDCKVEGCKEAAAGAPLMPDHLCSQCREHFAVVTDYLDQAGVSYELDPHLVRGLDYYIRTTFEVKAGDLGAQDAVAGGGRYDGLISQLGGPALGGIGFAAGLERLALILDDDQAVGRGPDLFIAALGEDARRWGFKAASALRAAGMAVEMMAADASLKAQMRRANKLEAEKVLIVGPEELAKGAAQLKEMKKGVQSEIALDAVLELLR